MGEGGTGAERGRGGGRTPGPVSVSQVKLGLCCLGPNKQGKGASQHHGAGSVCLALPCLACLPLVSVLYTDRTNTEPAAFCQFYFYTPFHCLPTHVLSEKRRGG